jgi:hypothetical protein
MNWIGGVESPEIAMQLLTQGGIPNSAVTEGGQITHIQIEHIWAEAWIDFFPSRGARHRTGDSWIPLDASFKRHQLQSGIDWETSIPFDSHNFATQLENTACTGNFKASNAEDKRSGVGITPPQPNKRPESL